MKMKKAITVFGLMLALASIVSLTGCADKTQVPNVVYVPQQCQAQMPLEPQWSDENGSRADKLQGILENSGKKDSYIYDLKATLHKCIDKIK